VSPGARDQKRRETHGRIERAALELFANQGFEATSIEDIAEQAEVGPRTVLRYFAAKRDLVFATADADLAVLRGMLGETAPDLPATDAVVEAVEAFADHLDREITRSRARAVGDDEALNPWASAIRDEWASVLGADLARGRKRLDEHDGAVLVSSALFALQQAVVAWSTSPDGARPLRAVVTDRMTALRRLGSGV
jgi:AcrR family transcriptional regulator